MIVICLCGIFVRRSAHYLYSIYLAGREKSLYSLALADLTVKFLETSELQLTHFKVIFGHGL